jgi:putative CocE/NonD family hydrolase
MSESQTPALHIGGWYDVFLWSALQHYQGMCQRGDTEHARRNQHLIIGPWSHMNFTGSFPEREFGASASSDAIDLTGIQLRWFDRWLKDVDNSVEEEPPVMIFVMGSDTWRTETDWPLHGTQSLVLSPQRRPGQHPPWRRHVVGGAAGR